MESDDILRLLTVGAWTGETGGNISSTFANYAALLGFFRRRSC